MGEVSFLSGEKRISTTVCKTDCLVMVVSRMGFMKSMKVVPEVAVKLLWNLGMHATFLYYAVPTRLDPCAM